ncbi:MAG: SusC/RagA family TonB-linked outer membrane protein [Bacteroidetes bacterium MedPE-SWsnd-G1]|nr:MAG: SusC/RagA family TonB-linked outer membrane protein [Bacteroidetes bacterium MedPE-SWsnd-G1]
MKNNLLKKMFFVAIMLTGSVIFAQTVTGTISDANGPLPGANIVVKGTTNGVDADFDGNFTLDNVGSDAVLVVSFLGYVTQEVNVAGQSVINVTLAEDANELDEVVVFGYTAQTRGDVTGSVASVDMEEALQAPTVNAAEALQGRVTGVTVVTNGSPGSAPKINIRGFGTSNNTNPLYIIDGVQTDDPNTLNNINPADIEQMNVLKDGAAAIYGARASNGVVVITTKGGGYNMASAKVSLDMYTGFSQISDSPSVLNAQQHADVLLQSYLNDGVDTTHGQYDPSGTGNYTVPSSILGYRRVVSYDPIVFSDAFNATTEANGTDWLDAITRTAPTSNVSLSVQNGNESGKYFMSVSYLNRDGIMNHTGFERASTRLNSEFKVKEKLRIGEHINISYSNTLSGNGEAIENSFRMTPLLPVRDDDGNFTGVAAPDLGNTRNPAAQLYRSKDNYNKRYAVFGDVYLSYDILDELTFKTTLAGGFNTFDSRAFTYLDPEHGEPISTNTLAEQDQTAWNWAWTNTLNYNKSFGDHSINALVGIEALKNESKGKGVSRTGYLFEDPDFYLLNNGSGAPNVDYAYAGWDSLWSIFGTANYSYKDKYYFTGTLRRDTSSRFKGDNQSDIFPSFSGGWVLSKEDFYPEDAFVGRIKVKASWGELGNQTLPASNPTINISSLNEGLANYAFNGNASSIATGALLSQVGNPDLVWETSVATNFGVDLSMLDSKIGVGLEFYQIKTKDLITRDFGLINSTAIDAGAPLVNLGDVKNTGFDLALSYGDETDGGFSYNLSANISSYKNEVTALIDGAPVAGRGDLRNGAVTRTEVGGEMSYFYGRQVAGLDSNGRMEFVDVNGDGVVNDDDRTNIGSPHPDFTYGLNANLAYKGFDAQLFFTGSQGNDIYNYNKVFTDFGYFFKGNRSTRVLDAWTPSNTNTNIPALTSSYPLEESSSNSYFVEDGSYFRLKNLQIGYTLPENISGKISSESIRFYVQATNLFTITDYSGFDPEVVAYDNLSLGVDSRLYPNSQIFTLGANIKF